MKWNNISLDNQQIYINKYGVISIKVAIPVMELKSDIYIEQKLSKINAFLDWSIDKIKDCKTYEDYQRVVYLLYEYGYADKFRDISWDMCKWYYNRGLNKWFSGIGNKNERRRKEGIGKDGK